MEETIDLSLGDRSDRSDIHRNVATTVGPLKATKTPHDLKLRQGHRFAENGLGVDEYPYVFDL